MHPDDAATIHDMLRRAHEAFERATGEPPALLYTNDVSIAAALPEALPGNGIGIIIDYSIPDDEFYFTGQDGLDAS